MTRWDADDQDARHDRHPSRQPTANTRSRQIALCPGFRNSALKTPPSSLYPAPSARAAPPRCRRTGIRSQRACSGRLRLRPRIRIHQIGWRWRGSSREEEGWDRSKVPEQLRHSKAEEGHSERKAEGQDSSHQGSCEWRLGNTTWEGARRRPSAQTRACNRRWPK